MPVDGHEVGWQPWVVPWWKGGSVIDPHRLM